MKSNFKYNINWHKHCQYTNYNITNVTCHRNTEQFL